MEADRRPPAFAQAEIAIRAELETVWRIHTDIDRPFDLSRARRAARHPHGAGAMGPRPGAPNARRRASCATRA